MVSFPISPQKALKITPFVAVYGTLKYGFPNHNLLKTSTALGVGYTQIPFKVFDVGYPYAVPSEDGFPLQVEVYKIPNEGVLKELDILEGYPEHYQRSPLKVVLRNGDTLKGWLYYTQNPRGEEVKTVFHDGKLNIDYITWRGSYIYLLESLGEAFQSGDLERAENLLKVLTRFLKTYGGSHKAVSPIYGKIVFSLLSAGIEKNDLLVEFLREVYRLVREGEISPIPQLEDFISKI